MDTEEKLEPRQEFPFPFTPYGIQQDFMSNLYNAMEEGKLGIFESPTGTGKSLSIICGALSWLQDHEERVRRQLTSEINQLQASKTEAAGDDWLNEQAGQVVINQKISILKQKLKLIQNKDEKIEKLRSRKKSVEVDKKYFVGHKDAKSDKFTEMEKTDGKGEDDDDDILLEEVVSEEEQDEDSACEEEDEYQDVKVYFCSRTHSQLAQFVGEVQRSSFSDHIRLIALASRQSYCINETVNKLKSLSLINERCLEMKKGSSGRATVRDDTGRAKKKSRCVAACPHRAQRSVEQLRDMALVQVLDVEQLVASGSKLKACPYYAAREAVKDSQLVVVPYNTVLHAATRAANNIRLQGNVVIIDEAHNLLETVAAIHSCEVSGQQLTHAYSQLTQYRARYHDRFSAANLLRLNQMVFLVGKLVATLGGKPGCNPQDSSRSGIDTKLYSLSEFVINAEVDNLNLYHLLAFCNKSKITQKLQGFTERYQPSVAVQPRVNRQTGGIRAFLQELAPAPASDPPPAPVAQPVMSNNPLMAVVSFLQCLTNHSADGRIMCRREASVGKGALKYLLLNPAAHLADIVQQARCVIVAGGTMQPVSEFVDRLFVAAGADVSRITQFSCGHVIPPGNILPLVMGQGPTGADLDFSFQHRDSKPLLTELGRLLCNVCNVVPAGVVCFFPSYDYEQLVYQHLEKGGVLAKLEAKKKIFREPKGGGSVDKVLSDYAAAINKAKDGKAGGALLFSVIGGKLSEGLNFSDDLGRCVIVVGLPYPNIKSPELQEKLNYLNATVGGGAGNAHYENLCMKAVNQSIGRAVRHQRDYAAVLLLDRRYARPNTCAALPSWIQKSLQTHPKFGPAFRELAKFFAEKNKVGDCKPDSPKEK